MQFQNIISENQVRAFKAPTGKYVIKISCCHCSCQLKHQIGRPSKLFTVIVVFLSYRCLYYKRSRKTIGWAPALLTNIRLGRNYLLVGQSSLFCQSINVEISQNIFTRILWPYSGERLVGGEAHQEADQVHRDGARLAPQQLPHCGRVHRVQGKNELKL